MIGYKVGDKVWVKEYATMKEGIYEVEDINEVSALLVGESRYGILLDRLDTIIVYKLSKEENKPIEKIADYLFSRRQINCGLYGIEYALDQNLISLSKKVDEIIEYINKEK